MRTRDPSREPQAGGAGGDKTHCRGTPSECSSERNDHGDDKDNLVITLAARQGNSTLILMGSPEDPERVRLKLGGSLSKLGGSLLEAST